MVKKGQMFKGGKMKLTIIFCALIFLDGCVPTVYTTTEESVFIVTARDSVLYKINSIDANTIYVYVSDNTITKTEAINKLDIKRVCRLNGEDITSQFIEKDMSERALMRSAEITTRLYNGAIFCAAVFVASMIFIITK